MKKLAFLSILLLSLAAMGQIDARLFRFPDVSGSQIAFVYGGDIWIVAKTGGTANRITSSTGEEGFPRFSPDGKSLAFSATYDGNTDVYTMPPKVASSLSVKENPSRKSRHAPSPAATRKPRAFGSPRT